MSMMRHGAIIDTQEETPRKNTFTVHSEIKFP